jgi:type I restriction enzyme R subunit
VSVEVAFVCAVKIVRWKFEGEDSGARRGYKLDAAVQGLVNQSVCSTLVIDILRVAGIKSPDISVLGEEFL